MKGQFMVISAVVIGLIMITTAATISETSSQRFSPGDEAYKIQMIQEEAESVDTTSLEDRRSFIRNLKSFESYSSEIDYWGAQDCFNVTLKKPETRLELRVRDC